MNTVSKMNINENGEKLTHTNIQRRNRCNEIYVNRLKMASGCDCCGFMPSNDAECRLLDLNHTGGGTVGAWAEKSTGKTADVSRLVWSGARLQRIQEELNKGNFLCKNCHCLEHYNPPARLQETEDYAEKRIADFLKKDGS